MDMDITRIPGNPLMLRQGPMLYVAIQTEPVEDHMCGSVPRYCRANSLPILVCRLPYGHNGCHASAGRVWPNHTPQSIRDMHEPLERQRLDRIHTAKMLRHFRDIGRGG